MNPGREVEHGHKKHGVDLGQLKLLNVGTGLGGKCTLQEHLFSIFPTLCLFVLRMK